MKNKLAAEQDSSWMSGILSATVLTRVSLSYPPQNMKMEEELERVLSVQTPAYHWTHRKKREIKRRRRGKSKAGFSYLNGRVYPHTCYHFEKQTLTDTLSHSESVNETL